MRGSRGRVRALLHVVAAEAAGRKRADARDLSRSSGGRGCIPPSPVHDDRGCRPCSVPPARLLQQARLGNGDRLRDRRHSLGSSGLHRHERRRTLQRAHGGGRQVGPATRVQRRVPRRLGRRAARRRPRPAGRRRLLRFSHRHPGQQPGLGDRRPDRPRLRRLADLGLRPPRRRHLHQGRRRRRRPRRQDRGRDPRGRPAQPGRDRGQRRRQRRRLRRHGSRPLRDVRRHGGCRDAARDGVPTREPAGVPAGARRCLDPGVGDRDLLRPDRQERLDHQRALQERHRRHGPLGHRLHPRHDGVRRGPLQLRRALRLGPRRSRDHVPAGRDHRVLHRLALESRQVDLQGLTDGSCHEHHRGPRRRACARPLLLCS